MFIVKWAGEGGEDEDGKKKMRTTFTGKQIFELERSFEAKKYLSSAERAELALSLAVTQQQVKLNYQLTNIRSEALPCKMMLSRDLSLNVWPLIHVIRVWPDLNTWEAAGIPNWGPPSSWYPEFLFHKFLSPKQRLGHAQPIQLKLWDS